MSQFTPTERTKVRRKPDRGSYDRELIYKILDEAFVCQVAFVVDGAPFCLNVTLLDGIVLSPTATGHSVNYRSVVVMGKAEPVEGEEAKRVAMRDFVEYVIRGRWATVRPPSEQEL